MKDASSRLSKFLVSEDLTRPHLEQKTPTAEFQNYALGL